MNSQRKPESLSEAIHKAHCLDLSTAIESMVEKYI